MWKFVEIVLAKQENKMKLVIFTTFIFLTACSSNLLDGNNYSYLPGFLCHPDGSLILAQKANSSGGFAEPRVTETVENCNLRGTR